MFGVRTRVRNHLHRRLREIVAQTPLIPAECRDRVSIHPSVVLNDDLNGGTITLGEWVMIASGVSLLTGRHDPAYRDRQRMLDIDHLRTGHDIVVERGAWLASNVTVLGPCRIGEYAVVAAGAVVTKDVRPGEIVGGVPAKHIGWAEGFGPG